jgi:hypothetical protein
MPLFGLNLFAARAIFKDPMGKICGSILPFVVVDFVALVLTCLPAMLLRGSAHWGDPSIGPSCFAATRIHVGAST